MRLVYSRSGPRDRAIRPLSELVDLDGDPLLQALGLLVEHVCALVGCVGTIAEADVGLHVEPLTSFSGEGVEEALLLVGSEREGDGLGFVHESSILQIGVD
tara:strand:+ start:1426 stop:1728 length:303 start_codon:yes stop_codon:yes gene_type:complete